LELVTGGAVVTGASRGIGEAIAVVLGRAGAGVVVNYRAAREEGERVAQSIVDAGGRAVAVQADVADEADVRRLAETAREEIGEIGIVVSGAASPVQRAPFHELEWADYQAQLDTTVRGLYLLTRAFLPAMIERGEGRVIGLSTTQVDAPLPGRHAYVTAKAALEGMLRALAVEVGEHGVTVNYVVPGFTETDRAAALPAEFKERYAARTPVRRIARPDDVASAVLYLASREAAYVTGTGIRIDGGHGLA
jgi:3-oxoacyl-[acyl-carrier protein] reductase